MSTPIKHVILLMKENRTSDQVLGDMGYARRMYARPPATPEGARSSEAGVQISGVEDPVLKEHTSFYFRQHDRSSSF
ncbi:MAG TPA: hypothetical protein VK604_23870 [Bryobacteraceae bacterium]|nr:hypothetical protein [Bryobacteraceae bacterium]